MYLRAFSKLEQENRDYISSNQLAQRVHLKSAQIRKDFSYFGEFGTCGIGYPVASTANQIRTILNCDGHRKIALISNGQLCEAIFSYLEFLSSGFEIVEISDCTLDKTGNTVNNGFCKIDTLESRGIHLAILAVPVEAAQQCADKLTDAGIRAILNLTPCHIETPKTVKVKNIDIATELGALLYYL